MSGTNFKSPENENSKFSFSSSAQFSFQEIDNKKQRKFAGVAYSGEVIRNHWYWENVMFDLSTMDVPNNLPALVDHDRSQRCGYLTGSAVGVEGLTVQGVLLSNEAGSAVASESDEGFPWQMSVHIEPGSVEQFSTGETATFNGRSVPGPVSVFKNSRIVEVSFTATGYDPNTSAVAMSRGTQESGDEMELKELQAKLNLADSENSALKQKLQASEDELKKFKLDLRAKEVSSLMVELGKQVDTKDAEQAVLFGLDDAAFTAVSKMLRSGKSIAANPELFKHQAINGDTQKTKPVENPLMSNALSRKTEFSKQSK
jgi:hypothetical protein